MEREKLEKKDSSERNSWEGRRDDDVADAALLPQNQEMEQLAFNDSDFGFDFDFGPVLAGLDEEAVSLALFNQSYSRRFPHLLTPLPENQQLTSIIDAAFKNLDQQTVDKGSAAPPENQEARREIESYNHSGGGGGEKEAAELLPRRRDSEARGDIISAEADFKKFFPQTLDDPTEFDPRILDEFPDLGPYSDQENLGIGDTATTAPPTTTTVASNLPPPLQNQNTVSSLLKLQVGLFGLGRVLEDQIINNANASTSENAPSRLITATETALALLKYPKYCIGGCSSVEVKNNTSMEEWKEAFEQCYNEECSRVAKVTTAYNNRTKRRIPKLEALHDRYIVVTMLVFLRGEHELPFINSWGDMETALKKLVSIPSGRANDSEVLWSPEDKDGTLSDKELLESYPSIKPFDNVLRRLLM